MTVRITKVYQENNKLTSTFLTDGEILANYFSSIQNGKAVQGVTEFIQHFGVAVERYLDETGEFILSGHVTIPGVNFTPGEKVAANIFGTIGTLDKIDGSPFSRVGGVVFIIGIALTDETFYMNFEHTKPLVQILVEGRKYMLELFSELDYKAPSPAFPAVCISRLHPSDTKTIVLQDTNWIELVPALRLLSLKVGANTPNIAYSSFTPGVITEVTLLSSNSASINTPLLETIEGMIRYFNDLDATEPLTGSHFLNLHLTMQFKGEDARIVDINRITETITIDYDSSALSSDAGDIQIYPYRLASIFGNTASPDNLAKAQFRKLRPETSIASGYSPGLLFENRYQKTNYQVGAVLGLIAGAGFSGGVGSYNAGYNTPSFDAYGDEPLRTGKTTRGNLLSSYIYLFGGRYVP